MNILRMATKATGKNSLYFPVSYSPPKKIQIQMLNIEIHACMVYSGGMCCVIMNSCPSINNLTNMDKIKL